MATDALADVSTGRADDGLFPLRSATGGAVVAATVLASMVGFLDAYMIKVAIPAIGHDLSAGVTELQWVLTGYLVTVAALLLLAGALADHFGRRRTLIAGLLVMLVASMCCAAVSTLGTTLGPYGGGWLVDHASWRYVFLLNLPLIAAACWALRLVPEVNRTPRPLSLDLAGGLLAVLGLGGVIYALTQGPSSGWDSVLVLASGAAGILCLAALAPVEQRRSEPMLRTSLFLSRQFDAINAATVLFYGALAAASYLVVLQCELRLGYSASAAGAALIPESAVFLLVSPLVGGLTARVGTRLPMATGILIVAAGFAWLSTAQPGDAYAEAILPGALLWGLGIGLTVAPLTAGVLAAVDDTDLGEASAINDAASRVGGVVLIALVPALLGTGTAGLAQSLATGYQTAMLIMAGLSLLAALITALFV